MKIPTQSVSSFLQKQDLPRPIVTTIESVEYNARLNNPHVLHFGADQLKPLPLTVTNRRTVVAAYGEESDHWKGRPIEIYVDPNVTNSNGQMVGGIRLRVPLHAPMPAPSPRPALPAPSGNGHANGNGRPAAAATAAKQEMTADEKCTWIVAAMAVAQTDKRLADLKQAWDDQGIQVEQMTDQVEDAYHAAWARLHPELAAKDSGIPF